TFRARHDAGAAFSIEESGPLRWLVRWDGSHKAQDGSRHFDFRVRLTIYAGAPYVRVEHILFNRLDPEFAAVRSLAAKLPIQLGDALTYSAGRRYRAGPGLPSVVLASKEPIRLELHRLIHHRIVNLATG